MSAPSARRFGPFAALSQERFPWSVLLLSLLLLGLGLTVVRSMASVDELFQRSDVNFDAHLQKVLLTAPLLLIGLSLPPRWLKQRTFLFYGLAILLLLAVPLIGEERNNARRWIPTPVGFDLQPSEFAKLAVILALAKLGQSRRLQRPGEWLAPAAVVALPMLLVAAQPDLGTSLTLVPIALGMAFLAGASGRLLVGLLLAAGATALCATEFQWIKEYQLRRVQTWLDTWDPQHLIDLRSGPPFHVYQARVSIGNGGLSGTGLGQGISSTAAHLPERDCDSIFCVVAEEGGFLGATALVVLYLSLILLLLSHAGGQRDRYTRLVLAGIALYFAGHLFINSGVNLGLVPMTGLTLPLLSTGGSSMMVTFLSLGLALGLIAREEPAFDPDSFRD
jgi:rod shape determining protein RodA